MSDDNTIVIASAARTPVGSFNGSLASLPAHELGKVAIKAALERAGVQPGDVSEVILGQVLTAGQGQNPARQASIAAGIPVESPAWGMNQVCGSGLRAVALGAQQIQTGRRDDRRRRRPGEHEPVAARRAPAQRHKMGDLELRRHHDQGRPVGRLQRLPHGHDGRERRAPVADHPRGAGQVRRRLAEQGRGRQEGRQVQGRDRARHHQGQEGRHRRRRGRVHPRRRHARRHRQAAPGLRQGRHRHRRQRLAASTTAPPPSC